MCVCSLLCVCVARWVGVGVSVGAIAIARENINEIATTLVTLSMLEMLAVFSIFLSVKCVVTTPGLSLFNCCLTSELRLGVRVRACVCMWLCAR